MLMLPESPSIFKGQNYYLVSMKVQKMKSIVWPIIMFPVYIFNTLSFSTLVSLKKRKRKMKDQGGLHLLNSLL